MSQIGSIDCGILATYQGKLDQHIKDPYSNIDAIADAEAAKAVLENQEVNVSIITGSKKRKLSVEWLTNCNITTESCSDDCTINGVDATPECQEYEIVCLRESAFKMAKRAYRERTYEFNDAFLFNMLSHKKALDEWLAGYIITGLSTNATPNLFTGGEGTVVGNVTNISAQHWNDNIWGYFNRVTRGNKLKSPYLLTGDNLFRYIFNRQHESATEAGKAGMAKMGTISRIYQDPENVEAIAPASTFLIHKTAAAFLNKAWNPLGATNAIAEAGVYTLWSEPSSNIPGVYYDIIAQETCSDNEFYLAVKVQLHGVFAANPAACDNGNGILRFACV